MNVHESDKIAALLTSHGLTRTDDHETADILIFNTCTVRNTAEEKIISHIGLAHSQKRGGRRVTIAVVGCLSQREGVATSLMKKFPRLDIILGTHNIGRIATAVDNATAGKKTLDIITEREDFTVPVTDTVRTDNTDLVTHKPGTDTHFINITYGCENYCTYCIVPYVRGKLISRPMSEIESEFAEYKTGTVYLLGQNVNSYKCPETNTDFVGLLRHLSRDTNVMLNFLSSHPRDFTNELAAEIASNPRIDKNIHLPIQSGSTRILKLMNRGYTADDFRAKIANLRALCVDVKLTTDIICGFPSETDDDFAETMQLVRDIKFNAAFIFPYSRRSGTPADKMPDQIPQKIKKERTTKLIELQRQIANAKIQP